MGRNGEHKMAIDPLNPKDYYDDDGNIRRRENVAVTLTEGDVLIDQDGEPYVIEDGEITIYTTGRREGDGTPVLIERMQVLQKVSAGKTVWNIDELGLK